MKQNIYQFDNTIETYHSAVEILPILRPFLTNSKKVLDIGCGLGGFSRALSKMGEFDITMVDHPSIPTNQISDIHNAKFFPVDLDKDLPPATNYDLIICTEVLEHFTKKRSLELLDFICANSDIVLFSAAIPRQSGNGHINLHRHSFWHHQFLKYGFKYFDGFKKDLLGKDNVKFWYRHNLFLYYTEKQSHLFKGFSNITETGFEIIYTPILDRPYGFRELMTEFYRLFQRKFFHT